MNVQQEAEERYQKLLDKRTEQLATRDIFGNLWRSKVEVLHQDGSFFSFSHASVVEEDGKVFVFSEHNGAMGFYRDDLEDVRVKPMSEERKLHTIKNKLRSLLQYFEARRQIGHTTAMIRGASQVPGCVVIAENESHRRSLQRELPEADVQTLDQLQGLLGKRAPLLIDNAAQLHLLQDALNEIEWLEKSLIILSLATK
jgi:hypothetical protein